MRPDGPESPLFSGLSSRITSAVMTLAMLAAGIGVSFPELATMPSPETATAAEPALGHGSAGTVPAVVDWPGTAAVTGTAGIGRKKLKVRNAAIRSSNTPAIRSRISDKIAGPSAQRPCHSDVFRYKIKPSLSSAICRVEGGIDGATTNNRLPGCPDHRRLAGCGSRHPDDGDNGRRHNLLPNHLQLGQALPDRRSDRRQRQREPGRDRLRHRRLLRDPRGRDGSADRRGALLRGR